MIEQLQKVIHKAKMMIKHTFISGGQTEGADFYFAQVKAFNSPSRSPMYYPYGYAANPPVGAMGVTLNVLGQEENQMTFPYTIEDRWLNLQSGEVQLGNHLKQTSIKFDSDGNATIVTTGQVTIKGDLLVTGDITANSDSSSVSMSDIKEKYNDHTHVSAAEGSPSSTTSDPLT